MYIYHISDIHFNEENVEGIKKLQKIIENINSQPTKPDVVVITGDLVWKCHKEFYASCFKELNKLQAPYLVIGGNHDASADLLAAIKQFYPEHPIFENIGKLNYVCDKFPVRFIGLDTYKAEVGGGELSLESQKWLEQALEDNSEGKPTVILIHQYTLPTGSGFFDRHAAPWYKEFNQIIAKHNGTVKLVLCGHLHNSLSSSIAGIPIVSGFSTNWGEELLNKNNPEPKRDFNRPLSYLIHSWNDKAFTTYVVELN